ncbi:hypothetical protein PR048_007300 [Dryococelus australis]|uniref:Uncharacterized protein n=1 Tax=Dryococelus australis TaxID=614101 RepID=A0ABQ9IE70_9NEOP|nr:hypothetical protein PR048_007300 [Dryococelus australis]
MQKSLSDSAGNRTDCNDPWTYACSCPQLGEGIQNMPFLNSMLDVDTFFLVGGMVRCYTLLKELDNRKFNYFISFFQRYLRRRDIVTHVGSVVLECDVCLALRPGLLLHRLTPAYAAMIAVFATVYLYLGNGPEWYNGAENQSRWCRQNWLKGRRDIVTHVGSVVLECDVCLALRPGLLLHRLTPAYAAMIAVLATVYLGNGPEWYNGAENQSRWCRQNWLKGYRVWRRRDIVTHVGCVVLECDMYLAPRPGLLLHRLTPAYAAMIAVLATVYLGNGPEWYNGAENQSRWCRQNWLKGRRDIVTHVGSVVLECDMYLAPRPCLLLHRLTPAYAAMIAVFSTVYLYLGNGPEWYNGAENQSRLCRQNWLKGNRVWRRRDIVTHVGSVVLECDMYLAPRPGLLLHRLTPAYAAMIAVFATVYLYLGNGPEWYNGVEYQSRLCRQNWLKGNRVWRRRDIVTHVGSVVLECDVCLALRPGLLLHRLTPAYAAMIAVFATVYLYLGNGPEWYNGAENQSRSCRQNWLKGRRDIVTHVGSVVLECDVCLAPRPGLLLHRLTPAYAAMIAVFATVYLYLGNGPEWYNGVENQSRLCRQNWLKGNRVWRRRDIVTHVGSVVLECDMCLAPRPGLLLHRLTPAYAAMIAVFATVYLYLGNGPEWYNGVEYQSRLCRQNWLKGNRVWRRRDIVTHVGSVVLECDMCLALRPGLLLHRLTPAYAAMIAVFATVYLYLGNGPEWYNGVEYQSRLCRQNWLKGYRVWRRRDIVTHVGSVVLECDVCLAPRPGLLLHRLTPAYAAMIAVFATVYVYLGNGPEWYNGVEYQSRLCRQNWMWNVLYVNNYVERDSMTAKGISIDNGNEAPSEEKFRILSYDEYWFISKDMWVHSWSITLHFPQHELPTPVMVVEKPSYEGHISREHHRNKGAIGTGEPRGNLPISGIVRHYSQVRKFGGGGPPRRELSLIHFGGGDLIASATWRCEHDTLPNCPGATKGVVFSFLFQEDQRCEMQKGRTKRLLA